MTLLQTADDDHASVCTAVMESYPPQCSGPTVIGEVPWSDIDAEEADGTRCFDGWVVGRFDSEGGTFTLDRTPSKQRPAGAVEAEEPQSDHAQVCDDPTRDAKDGGRNDQEALSQKIDQWPG